MKKTAFNLRLSQAWLPPKILLIMKLIIIIMTACLMQVSAAGFAQKITYRKNGATLEQIFSEIRKQTGYYVVYAENKVNKEAKLDVNFRNTELNKVLDVISNSQNLEYSLDDKNISLKPKEESVLDKIIARFQTIDVRGKVVDSLGNGLAGATVSVKNGKSSTQTAANGDFQLKNVEEGAVLVISFLGYLASERSITKDFMYVQLQMSTSKLDEVQVIAYGNTTRRLSTGNITTIKAEDIERQPVNNALLALQGKVPNLIISPGSGSPGAPIRLQLRGQNSLARDFQTNSQVISEPMIIIDGIPYTNNVNSFGALNSGHTTSKTSAISFINPSDIESIDVLTDADATSIYGSRGGNGVILITTKRGKPGKTNVYVKSNTGFSVVPRMLEMMNTQDYLEMRKEALANDMLTASANPNENRPGFIYAPDITIWDQTRYTNWQERFLGGRANMFGSDVSINGGSGNIQYLVSASRAKQGTVFPGDYKNENSSLHFNLGAKSQDGKLTTALSGNYLFNVRSNPSGGDLSTLSLSLAPNAPDIYNSDGELNWQPNPTNGRATWTNPYSFLLRATNEKNNSVLASTSISYRIANNLESKITLGLSRIDSRIVRLEPLASKDPSLPTARGRALRNVNQNTSFTFDPQLIYSANLSHGRLEALAGISYQDQGQVSEFVDINGYTEDALLLNMGSAIISSANVTLRNSSSFYKYLAFYGRANYNWKNKYLINITARRDGSSRFGPGEQFGNYWSIGTGWVLSEEPFMKQNVSFLTFAKIRASYGSSGSDGIGDYRYLDFYESLGNGIIYQGVSPIKTNGAVNPYYHWEDIRKGEVSIEAGLLDDKILISTSLFRTISSDQLGQISLPATAGGLSITANQPAKIQNAGVEIQLNSKNILKKMFSWSTSINFGIQKNKLLKRPVNSDFGSSLDPRVMEGEEFYGVSFVREYRGVNAVTGLYQFVEPFTNVVVSEFGGLDVYNKRINTLPIYSGGLLNTFKYKNLDLSVFCEFRKQKGKDFLRDLGLFSLPGYFTVAGNIGNLPKEYIDRWRKAGDVKYIQKVSATPGTIDVLSNGAFVSSDRFWVDASYIRVNNLSVGYEVPKDWIERIKISRIRFHVDIQNLLTITNYRGLDPQIQSLTVLPQLRTIVAGLQISL